MQQNSTEEYFLFDGKFTDDVRKRFQRKRLELGLPYQRLGPLFGANWSTIRKWEIGPTSSCSKLQIAKIENFLNGKYDDLLAKNQQFLYGNLRFEEIPECVSQCMEKFNTTYQLLRYRPDLREKLLKRIDKITSKTLQTLINKEINKS